MILPGFEALLCPRVELFILLFFCKLLYPCLLHLLKKFLLNPCLFFPCLHFVVLM